MVKGKKPLNLEKEIEEKYLHTLKKMLEKQNAEHLKELSEMARNLAHEIRNPLASIRAGAQRIEEKILSDNPSHKYALLIIREVDRLERIIKDLLEKFT